MDWIFEELRSPVAMTIWQLLALIAVAAAVNFGVKQIVLKLVHALLGKTRIGQDDDVPLGEVINRVAHIMPALVISLGIALVAGLPSSVSAVVSNVANAYIILTISLALVGVLSVVDVLYARRPEARLRPIKGYLQVGKIAIFAVCGILIVASLLDQSPLILLSGLGAMAAVLMLVFQDTLLAFVAGVQLSSTEIIRVGDWIEMPSMNTDGEILEISLHTVTVRNWDHTITAIPIRKMVTDTFKNWRGMQESGGRRIKRCLHIDQTSVRFLSEDDILGFKELDCLRDYLEDKSREIEAFNQTLHDSSSNHAANTRRLTNLGTFRAYLNTYLRRHGQIHQNMMVMVRQLPPGPKGVPIEIYCFTKTVNWTDYEGIQSDIFDHVLAVLPDFGLRIFQEPTGSDFRAMQAA